MKPIYCKASFGKLWPMAEKRGETFEDFKTKVRLFAVLPTLLDKLVGIYKF